MSKQKTDKFTATTIPDKTHPEKPFVQLEGKLTEAQLEAIAGGVDGRNRCKSVTCNHNHSVVSIKEVIMSPPPPEKTRQQKPFVQVEGELTEARLEAIAAGGFTVN